VYVAVGRQCGSVDGVYFVALSAVGSAKLDHSVAVSVDKRAAADLLKGNASWYLCITPLEVYRTASGLASPEVAVAVLLSLGHSIRVSALKVYHLLHVGTRQYNTVIV
jgi:hypothetical protein